MEKISFFIVFDFGCYNLFSSQSKVWHNNTKKKGTDWVIDVMESTLYENEH